MLGFFAEAESTKLDIDYNEIEDAHWFSIEELKSLQHPSIKKMDLSYLELTQLQED